MIDKLIELAKIKNISLKFRDYKLRGKNKKPIENVSINYNNTGTTTDKNGYYQLRVPYKKEITLTYSHISYRSLTKKYGYKLK